MKCSGVTQNANVKTLLRRQLSGEPRKKSAKQNSPSYSPINVHPELDRIDWSSSSVRPFQTHLVNGRHKSRAPPNFLPPSWSCQEVLVLCRCRLPTRLLFCFFLICLLYRLTTALQYQIRGVIWTVALSAWLMSYGPWICKDRWHRGFYRGRSKFRSKHFSNLRLQYFCSVRNYTPAKRHCLLCQNFSKMPVCARRCGIEFWLSFKVSVRRQTNFR